MFRRLRSAWLAGGGALLLALSLSGVVAAGATFMGAGTAPAADPGDPGDETDTTLTFEDVDGDGIDDDCEVGVEEPNPDAAKAAFEAVDLDGDGDISVSEAARSGWIGGKNCNHGGYVSAVARGLDTGEGPTDVCQDENGTEVACDGTEVDPADDEDATDAAKQAREDAKAEQKAEKREAKEAAKQAREDAKAERQAAKKADKEARKDAKKDRPGG